MSERAVGDPQTGGTLEVSGTIKFHFKVESADCNVFTLTELREAIEADKIGWFIDYYLGGVTPEVKSGTEEPDERYEVIDFHVRFEGDVESEIEVKTLEKYLVLDPDEVGFDAMRQPLPADDEVFE